MGAFHKHQMQDASRELFTYAVKCIQIRRKLRVEKRQQVGCGVSPRGRRQVGRPPPGGTGRWGVASAGPQPGPALPPGPTLRTLSLWTPDSLSGVCSGCMAGTHAGLTPGAAGGAGGCVLGCGGGRQSQQARPGA